MRRREGRVRFEETEVRELYRVLGQMNDGGLYINGKIMYHAFSVVDNIVNVSLILASLIQPYEARKQTTRVEKVDNNDTRPRQLH